MRVQLPDCMMSAYRRLFPTLDFSRITFNVGIPAFYDRGQGGITLTTFWGEIDIYLRADLYAPCERYTFSKFGHELVHALQAQQNSLFGGNAGGWIFSYVWCFLQSFTSEDSGSNAYENEAYAFENRLTACMRQLGEGPCACANSPVPVAAPDFVDALLRQCPDLVKTQPRGGDCSASTANLAPVVGPILAFIWAVISAILAAIVAIIYVIVDAIMSFFEWLGSVLNPPAGGSLNLLFSTDGGSSYFNKVTFERSLEQPAPRRSHCHRHRWRQSAGRARSHA